MSVWSIGSTDAKNADTAFVDVRVVPMDQPRVLEGHTVLIRDQAIVALGPNEQVPVPEQARRIEGAGFYLLPGLADMHVHMWTEADRILYLANGVTTVRNMDGRPFHLSYRERVRTGEVVGPDMVTAGPIVNHRPAPVPVKTAEQAYRLVDAQAAEGYDFVKVYSFVKREVYDALIERGRAVGLPVAGHVPSRMPIEHVLAMGQASMEHLLGYSFAVEAEGSPARALLRRGTWTFRYQYCGLEIDDDRMAGLAVATAEAGVWNCPTLVMMDRWLPAEEIQRKVLDQPHMRFIDPRRRALWSAERFLGDSTPELRHQGRTARRSMVRALRDVGAGLLLGTDAGASYVEPGFSIHAELEAFVEAGLTPFEAIAAGTRDAARFLGAEETFGMVTPGLRADLMLVDANPLTDVGALKRLIGVMVRGRWIPSSALECGLERLSELHRSAGAA